MKHHLGPIEVFMGRVHFDVKRHIPVGSLAPPRIAHPGYNLVDDPEVEDGEGPSRVIETIVGFPMSAYSVMEMRRWRPTF